MLMKGNIRPPYLTGEPVWQSSRSIDAETYRKYAIQALCIDANSRILDIFFGTRSWVAEITAEAWKTHYFGLETSEAPVRKASRMFKSYTEKRKAAFSVYSGEKIPYVTRFFHRVLCRLSGAEHISGYFFTEAYRVLGYGGILVVLYQPRKAFDEAVSLVDSALEAGFVLRNFGMYHLESDTDKNMAIPHDEHVLITLEKPLKITDAK